MHNEVIYLKKGTAFTLTGQYWLSVSDTFFENVHAVNKRTSIEQVIDKAADAKNIPGVIVTVKMERQVGHMLLVKVILREIIK